MGSPIEEVMAGVTMDDGAKRVWVSTPERFLYVWGVIMRQGLADPGDRFKCQGYEFGILPAEPAKEERHG